MRDDHRRDRHRWIQPSWIQHSRIFLTNRAWLLTGLSLLIATYWLPEMTEMPLAVAQAQSAPPTDPTAEADHLFQRGTQALQANQLPAAFQTLQQALQIYQQTGNSAKQASTLLLLGRVAESARSDEQAVNWYQRALALFQQMGDRPSVATSFSALGTAYRNLGQLGESLEAYQQALVIRRSLGDRWGQGITLDDLGNLYNRAAQYGRAVAAYEAALEIFRTLGREAPSDRARYLRAEGTTLNNLGLVYDALGQPRQSLELYQQALRLLRQAGDRQGESTSLNNIASLYQQQEQYEQALDLYQTVLEIDRATNNRRGEAMTLNNLALIYSALGKYTDARERFQQALAVLVEQGDRAGEAVLLGNLGGVHANLRQTQPALAAYFQSLAIRRELGDRRGTCVMLGKIGALLAAQNQPDLAIVFYKQAINQWETIRRDLNTLPVEQQQSFVESIADNYRELADLLLQQNRVLEAQVVLDLLKVQELSDYFDDVRGTENTTGIVNRSVEQQVQDRSENIVENAIAIGRELTQLEKQWSTVPVADRPPEQQARIRQLRQQIEQVKDAFLTFLDSPEVRENLVQLRQQTGGEAIDLGNLPALQNNLQALQQNAVLLYPFVVGDRLELVLVTPDSPPIRATVAVSRAQLNAAVQEFRSALNNPNSDPRPAAQRLYNWLIRPLESSLTTIEAQTILYAPDGILRYIPLAALHDGQQWLVERFRINNITAASLDEINTQPRRSPQIFAAAFSEGDYTVEVGRWRFPFQGLPFAGKEVQNLAALIPGTTLLLNRDFTPATVLDMNDYTIVHLATHATFVVGTPDDSFILFGDGEYVTLHDVRRWNLPNVDLVVLSACETAVGDLFGNGEEILGLGYQIQRTGAKAVLASLWQVSDGGTQALMNAFYTALRSGKTKAEALQQAQIALITGDPTVLQQVSEAQSPPAGVVTLEMLEALNQPPASVKERLAHPYYWAPFILIGNGL